MAPRNAKSAAAATSAPRARRQSCRALPGRIRTFRVWRAPRSARLALGAVPAAWPRSLTPHVRRARSLAASASLRAPHARREATKMRRGRRSASPVSLGRSARWPRRRRCRARQAATAIGPTSPASPSAHALMPATLAQPAALRRPDVLRAPSRRHQASEHAWHARRASIKMLREPCRASLAPMVTTARSVPRRRCHALAAQRIGSESP